MSTKSICRSCEMLVGTDEYHPHAACLMYRTCGDETAVRLNLAEVMAHGLEEGAADIVEELEEYIAQYGCDCGHPACNDCARTRRARAAIAKAKGVSDA